MGQLTAILVAAAPFVQGIAKLFELLQTASEFDLSDEEIAEEINRIRSEYRSALEGDLDIMRPSDE